MEQQKLKDAIRIISRTAKDYDDKLNGYNYIFIYKNRQNNQIAPACNIFYYYKSGSY